MNNSMEIKIKLELLKITLNNFKGVNFKPDEIIKENNELYYRFIKDVGDFDRGVHSIRISESGDISVRWSGGLNKYANIKCLRNPVVSCNINCPDLERDEYDSYAFIETCNLIKFKCKPEKFKNDFWEDCERIKCINTDCERYNDGCELNCEREEIEFLEKCEDKIISNNGEKDD